MWCGHIPTITSHFYHGSGTFPFQLDNHLVLGIRPKGLGNKTLVNKSNPGNLSFHHIFSWFFKSNLRYHILFEWILWNDFRFWILYQSFREVSFSRQCPISKQLQVELHRRKYLGLKWTPWLLDNCPHSSLHLNLHLLRELGMPFIADKYSDPQSILITGLSNITIFIHTFHHLMLWIT